MDTESLRIMKARREEVGGLIDRYKRELEPLQLEAKQLDAGIRAMEGVIPVKGLQSTRNAIVYHAKVANPDIQSLSLKQLITKALREHLVDGATANEMLDFFAKHWGRVIMRTSLSPQLSRLKENGIVELRGKVWHLARNGNEPPEGEPKDGSETAPNAQNKEATEC